MNSRISIKLSEDESSFMETSSVPLSHQNSTWKGLQNQNCHNHVKHDNWNPPICSQNWSTSEKIEEAHNAITLDLCSGTLDRETASKEVNVSDIAIQSCSNVIDKKAPEILFSQKIKNKNCIDIIRKKINNFIEICSKRKVSSSKNLKKCRSLDMLANNILEDSSHSISAETLSKVCDFSRPCSQLHKNNNAKHSINPNGSFFHLSSTPKVELILENILEKHKNKKVNPIDHVGSYSEPYSAQPINIITALDVNNISENQYFPGSPEPVTPNSNLVTKSFKILLEQKDTSFSDNHPILKNPSGNNISFQNLQNPSSIGFELQRKSNKEIVKRNNVITLFNNTALNEKENRSLTQELRELVKYGWYWGSMNQKEAEEKLLEEPDGAFLIRDSSDVKYLHTLSFKSYGKTFHTRIEHSNGWFSFYPQPDKDRYKSLVNLIEHCISESDNGVFCYSRPLLKGAPSIPVRLTKPVSRFMKVQSLQYLCRFVIRRYISMNHIQNLPVPSKIKGYLEESYY